MKITTFQISIDVSTSQPDTGCRLWLRLSLARIQKQRDSGGGGGCSVAECVLGVHEPLGTQCLR